MEPKSELRQTHRYITSHTKDGTSVFFDGISSSVPNQRIREDVTFQLLYTTTTFPAEMNGDSDIQEYQVYLNGDKPGLTIKGGSVLRVVNFAPDTNSDGVGAAIMHRTVSIDYGIVVAGEIVAELDSGETRKLGVGDVVVQRGTNHSWRNASQVKWARMVFVLLDANPISIGTKALGEELNEIPNVRSSS